MSLKKMGNIFPIKAAALEQEIAIRINQILRDKSQDFSSSLKKISLKTGIRRDTIKRWYEGRNPPSAGHLIILAQHYPAVLKMILDLSEYGHLSPHVGSGVPAEGDVTLNVTIKLDSPNLNERQLWFLECLRAGMKPAAPDICLEWPVLMRTARRDIAELKEKGLIRFSGSKKVGFYEIVKLL